ncbi:hypothetical protein Tco_0485517 [Tanacetum coccineum]
MLNKDNYVPWSSLLLCYAKSKPNGKLLVNSIKNDDIYAAIDSCKTVKEIWLRVEQMMRGSTIGAQEKKAKLFNEWEREDSQQSQVLNNLQSEWKRYVTTIHQTKDLYEVDYTQLYDFLKFNQAKVVLNAVQNLGVQNVRNQNGLIVVPRIANQNVNQTGNGNGVAARAGVRPRRRDAAYLLTQLLISQKEEAGTQLQAEEFDLMDVAGDINEIEEVNANCILMANLQQASTSGTQTNKAPVYDSNRSVEGAKFRKSFYERAAKFVRDFKSLAKEADESLDKILVLEKENERLLRAVVSQDIMSIVLNPTIVESFDLQTEL